MQSLCRTSMNQVPHPVVMLSAEAVIGDSYVEIQSRMFVLLNSHSVRELR